jgi:hypothetical protein
MSVKQPNAEELRKKWVFKKNNSAKPTAKDVLIASILTVLKATQKNLAKHYLLDRYR